MENVVINGVEKNYKGKVIALCGKIASGKSY